MSGALLDGLTAGFLATVPMTLVMLALFHYLPEKERYPLPPAEITMKVAEKAGLRKRLNVSKRAALTFLGHFAYGAGAGGVYALLNRSVQAPAVTGGILFGLSVWVVSYAGWLPAARLFSPPAKQPVRRNLLMIAAHVVWGGALGGLTRALA